MAGTLPNKGLEVSKPLQTWLGHFRITVQKCSVDTSEVLFWGVHRTLLNLYSEVSYVAISPFNPVSCRFHWLISSFSCSQMILHIYLITVCTYFEPGRPWADIIQEINKKSKNSNFLLFTKWLPDLDWFTAWITLGIGQSQIILSLSIVQEGARELCVPLSLKFLSFSFSFWQIFCQIMCILNGSVRGRVSSLRKRFWTLPNLYLEVSRTSSSSWTLPNLYLEVSRTSSSSWKLYL